MGNWVFILLTATAAAGAAEAYVAQSAGRIVGGTDALISNFPWQVSLQYSARHSCGGAIYSETIIVTAANCVKNANRLLLQVRAGSTYSNRGGSLVPVLSIKIHEDFNDVTLANDIAVLRLATPLKYGISIKPIALSTASPENGAAAVVSGWGIIRHGETQPSSSLQYADVHILSRSVCASNNYGYGNLIRANMICAAESGKDACQFDSGGPLVANSALVGIVSWGIGCASREYPGVYADVAVLRSWLIEAIKTVQLKTFA